MTTVLVRGQRVFHRGLPAVVLDEAGGQVWDVMRREWAPEPEPIEERQ